MTHWVVTKDITSGGGCKINSAVVITEKVVVARVVVFATIGVVHKWRWPVVISVSVVLPPIVVRRVQRSIIGMSVGSATWMVTGVVGGVNSIMMRIGVGIVAVCGARRVVTGVVNYTVAIKRVRRLPNMVPALEGAPTDVRWGAPT